MTNAAPKRVAPFKDEKCKCKKAQKDGIVILQCWGMVFAQEGLWSSSNLFCGFSQVPYLTFCVPNDLCVNIFALLCFLNHCRCPRFEGGGGGGAVASTATVAWGG